MFMGIVYYDPVDPEDIDQHAEAFTRNKACYAGSITSGLEVRFCNESRIDKGDLLWKVGVPKVGAHVEVLKKFQSPVPLREVVEIIYIGF